MAPTAEVEAEVHRMTDDPKELIRLPEFDREEPVYFSRDGEPLTFSEWANLFESIHDPVAYRMVGQDTVFDKNGREHFVSTVWLGLDHGFGKGPPVIFETMIFCHGHECRINDEQWRYCTEAQAEAGHAAAVQLVEETSTPLRERIQGHLYTYWEWICYWAGEAKRRILRRPVPMFGGRFATWRLKRKTKWPRRS